MILLYLKIFFFSNKIYCHFKYSLTNETIFFYNDFGNLREKRVEENCLPKGSGEEIGNIPEGNILETYIESLKCRGEQNVYI